MKRALFAFSVVVAMTFLVATAISASFVLAEEVSVVYGAHVAVVVFLTVAFGIPAGVLIAIFGTTEIDKK